MYWFMKFDATQVLFPFFFFKKYSTFVFVTEFDQLVHCDKTHYRSQEQNFLPDLGVISYTRSFCGSYRRDNHLTCLGFEHKPCVGHKFFFTTTVHHY
jgi:hypothetical protein